MTVHLPHFSYENLMFFSKKLVLPTFFILSAYTLFHKFRQAKNLGFYFFSVYLMSLMTVERRQNGARAPETNCAAFKLKSFPFTLSLLFTSIFEHFRM